jgi:hypothetical protein
VRDGKDHYCQLELRGFDLERTIQPGAKLVKAFGIDVESDDRITDRAKADCDRQADVTEPITAILRTWFTSTRVTGYH